jgi:hypothetical protein
MDPAILLKPLSEIEEWFLARVEEPALQAEDLLAVLKATGQDPARRAAAESWADLLNERLKKDHDTVHGVDLAELRASWLEGKSEAEVRQACDRWLTDLFSRKTRAAISCPVPDSGNPRPSRLASAGCGSS